MESKNEIVFASNIDKLNHLNLKRKDLTKLFTVTIDGDDAKDFDDAISFQKKMDGMHLFVHSPRKNNKMHQFA